jgi:formate-dependent nitrite reductase membrane component NrfD
MMLAATEHFAGAPEWTWFILFYFFVAGLAGGAYFLGTLLRYWGTPADEPVARLAFYLPLPAVLIGVVLLTLDLKQPLRFWHMLVNTTPGEFGLNFNTTTPMSVGVWALVVASVFALVAFVDSLVRGGRIRRPLARRLSARLDGVAGRIWNVAGTIVFLFVAGYTGVLLAVSNQPVWSDSWALGGLFLASGLSGSAALLLLLARRRAAPESIGMLDVSERLFALLEVLLVLVVVVTLIDDGTLGKAFGFPWILLWLVAFAGMLPGLRGLLADGLRAHVRTSAAVPLLVLAGVLALRAAVIFSAQS